VISIAKKLIFKQWNHPFIVRFGGQILDLTKQLKAILRKFPPNASLTGHLQSRSQTELCRLRGDNRPAKIVEIALAIQFVHLC
jgi:hypothetical protein